MTIEQQAATALSFWSSVCQTERANQVLQFALKNRSLETAVISTLDGKKCAAAEYGYQLYCNAVEAGSLDNEQAQESIIILSLLMAMEATRQDSWSYGTKLLCDLRAAGIKLNRAEVGAFLAQEGTWSTNPNKELLMTGNPYSTAIYCGHMATVYGSLCGKGLLFKNASPPLLDQIYQCWTKNSGEQGSAPIPCTTAEIIENLLQKYAREYLGPDHENNLLRFIQFLRTSDFYRAPSEAGNGANAEGGLAAYVLSCFIWLVNLYRPMTEREVGALVIASVGHDLCAVNTREKDWESEKVYCDDGDMRDPLGKKFRWQAKEVYTKKDAIPFGHGRKSLYILTSYFGGGIEEEVAAAIDSHMHDPQENPNIVPHMLKYPFCVYLSMAACMAAYGPNTDAQGDE